jgi:hypothetical protein
MAHTCNSSYLKGGDQGGHGSKLNPGKNVSKTSSQPMAEHMLIISAIPESTNRRIMAQADLGKR